MRHFEHSLGGCRQVSRTTMRFRLTRESAQRLATVALFIATLTAIEVVVLMARDIAKMGSARLDVKPSPPTATGGLVASSAHDSSATAQLATVALLFLTRGAMPLEPVWRLFLGAEAAEQAALRPRQRRRQQQQHPLFRWYIHPPVGYKYPPGSLFAGHEVPLRVEVHWAQHSMVGRGRGGGQCGAVPHA